MTQTAARIKRAHEEAIAIFARNLRDLLLAAPAGAKPTLGLDPGIRTGVKAAVVSEAGASVYSASELAAAEFPDLDVSLRGAVSIARRLQDPLAELVKITPQSIGVGQYQHDVDQRRLAQALDAVVEDAVNAVGVDLNMASAPLLARVAGLAVVTARTGTPRRHARNAAPMRPAVKDPRPRRPARRPRQPMPAAHWRTH